jgi:hypothetical protein
VEDDSRDSTQTDPWKIRSLWLMGILLCCGFIFLFVFFKIMDGGFSWVYITEEEVHQRIESGLPPGSTHSQVNDFLKQQNWIEDPELRRLDNFGTFADMLTGEEKRKVKWYSTGGIRPMAKNPVWLWVLVIGFYYDKEGKLLTYKVHTYRE